MGKTQKNLLVNPWPKWIVRVRGSYCISGDTRKSLIHPSSNSLQFPAKWPLGSHGAYTAKKPPKTVLPGSSGIHQTNPPLCVLLYANCKKKGFTFIHIDTWKPIEWYHIQMATCQDEAACRPSYLQHAPDWYLDTRYMVTNMRSWWFPSPLWVRTPGGDRPGDKGKALLLFLPRSLQIFLSSAGP